MPLGKHPHETRVETLCDLAFHSSSRKPCTIASPPCFYSICQQYLNMQVLRLFTWAKKGVSADADPHYQKLYGRVTDVCSNRRGQPSPSAMKEPRPGRNPSLIRFASPSGKYAKQGQKWRLPCRIFHNSCGLDRPQVHWATAAVPLLRRETVIASRPNG